MIIKCKDKYGKIDVLEFNDKEVITFDFLEKILNKNIKMFIRFGDD